MTRTKSQVGRPEAAAPETAGTPVASAPPHRGLRRDAERNRQAVLEAAKAVFAQRGLGASLEDVAQEAGLGVGTVYRRFPNRDALIDALFDDMVASIERILDESAALPRAWDGLVHFMTAMLESQGRDKGLRDTLLSRHEHPDGCVVHKEDVVHDKVRQVLHDLVARAQADGDLRADVVPTDLGVLLISGVGVVDFTAPANGRVWRRHLAVMLDGLRARPGGPDGAGAGTTAMDVGPLDDEQIEECMTGWKYGTRTAPRR